MEQRTHQRQRSVPEEKTYVTNIDASLNDHFKLSYEKAAKPPSRNLPTSFHSPRPSKGSGSVYHSRDNSDSSSGRGTLSPGAPGAGSLHKHTNSSPAILHPGAAALALPRANPPSQPPSAVPAQHVQSRSVHPFRWTQSLRDKRRSSGAATLTACWARPASSSSGASTHSLSECRSFPPPPPPFVIRPTAQSAVGGRRRFWGQPCRPQ